MLRLLRQTTLLATGTVIETRCITDPPHGLGQESQATQDGAECIDYPTDGSVR